MGHLGPAVKGPLGGPTPNSGSLPKLLTHLSTTMHDSEIQGHAHRPFPPPVGGGGGTYLRFHRGGYRMISEKGAGGSLGNC